MKSFSKIREELNTPLEKITIDEAIEYHIEKQIPFAESVFRLHSDAFYEFFVEARNKYKNGELDNLNPFDEELLNTDIGDFGIYEGEKVPLDVPIQEADEKDVELNSPKVGGPKKYYVYVKDGDKVKKVTWGDTTGLKVKINNPEARKSFAARHRCSQQNDRTTAAYWACNLPKYAKSLGLSGGGNFYW